MAALTWRNVDAPGLGAGVNASAQANRMFSDALKGLQNGLSNWQANTIANNDSALIADSLRYQDAASLREALQSGALLGGLNPTQFSPQALQAVDARQNDLLRQAGAMEQLSNAQYTNARNRDQNAIQDSARVGVNQLLQASAAGDPAAANQVLRDNAAVFAQLPPEQQAQLVANSQSIQGGDIRNRGSRFDLGVAQRNDADDQAAMAATVRLRRDTLDPVGLTEGVSEATRELSPGAASRVTNAFPSAFTGGGGPAPSAFASNIPFAETRSYVGDIRNAAGELRGTNREKAQQLMGPLIQKESGGRDDAVSPRGARGATQVMPATGSDPGYGVKPMQNQSRQEYERFSEDYLTAMLDKYDGDADKALAAYNAGPGNVDQWIRDLPPSTPAGRIDANQVELGQLTMTNNTRGGAAQDLQGNFGSNATIGSVAKQLTTTDFPGANEADVVRMLNKVVSDSGGTINPAQAGALLQRNITNANSYNPFSSGFWGTTALGGGLGVNDANLETAIAAQRNGLTESQALAGNEIQRLSASIEQAQQGAQQARQQYQQAVQQARARGNSPELAEAVERYRAQAEMAQLMLDDLLNRSQSIPGDSRQ